MIARLIKVCFIFPFKFRTEMAIQELHQASKHVAFYTQQELLTEIKLKILKTNENELKVWIRSIKLQAFLFHERKNLKSSLPFRTGLNLACLRLCPVVK